MTLSRFPALLIGLGVLSSGALKAHEGEDHEEHRKPGNHAKKGEHKDAPRSFASKPAKGTWARCPVSGDIFQVGDQTQFAVYEGRTYAFCCDECKPDFDKEAARYADKAQKAAPAKAPVR